MVRPCLGDDAAPRCATEGVWEWEGSVRLPWGSQPNPCESQSVAKYLPLCAAAPRFGFLSWKPSAHHSPLQPVPARVGATMPRTASSRYHFKWGLGDEGGC